MKANSRKRVLISSVAMLLVALVALGTSTYAWFTNAVQANANNLSVTANAAKGLQIRTDATEGWGTNQTWTNPTNTTISPLSIAFIKNAVLPTAYYAKQAGLDGAWTEEKAATATYEFESLELTNPSAYSNYNANYLSYKVDTRVVGDTSNNSYPLYATITAKSDNDKGLEGAIRIAIVNSADGKVYDVYGDQTIKAISNVSADGEVTTVDTAPTTAQFQCGTVSKTESTLYVYMWIEGQDTDCVDSLMNVSGNYKITFSAPAINE